MDINSLSNIGLAASILMVIIAVTLLFTLNGNIKSLNVKNQLGTNKREQFQKWIKGSKWLLGFSLLAVVILSVVSFTYGTSDDEKVTFPDIHGLGITSDGAEIYVPAHDGLKVFKDGIWENADAEKNDYMGFSMVDDGFYSSGHPGKGSTLKNPFGIVKSTDMGKTIEIVDLYKEVDFHGLAVGYHSHAIYVYNPQPNSKMDETGLFYSIDDAKTWTKSELKGIAGQLSTIAVHPTNEKIIALGTNDGLFVSKNYGQSFERLSSLEITSVSFAPNGELTVGSVSDTVKLSSINIETKEEVIIPTPELSKDNVIVYSAVNPAEQNELIFTTYEKDIFLSNTNGENWSQIAEKGTGINIKTHAEK